MSEEAKVSSVVGQPVTRVDGKLKVTGRAPYGVEHDIPNVAYGVGVASTIGNGTVRKIETSAAEKMPGVLAILHHGNCDKLYRPANQFEEMSRPGESRPPFEDDSIYYYGQFVALVIASTFEQAQDAAAHVRVEYNTLPPLVQIEKAPPHSPVDKHATGDEAYGSGKAKYERGDADSAFAQAEV